MSIICPYCGNDAPLIDSAEVYGGRDFGKIYACLPCKAWVGVHKGTVKPLGRLANKELREWKMKAHSAFDPLWKAKARHRQSGGAGKSGRPGGAHYKPAYARMSAYKWLAEQLGIDRKDCHIGMFDVDMCKRVVEICNPENIRKMTQERACA